jgi:5-methylcytosine-specific restriction protein A
MSDKMQIDQVPLSGPLLLTSIYRRSELHSRFGGSRFSGIVPSKREPVVLLFHTEEPVQQFYSDGFDAEDVYWYSGEGSTGDMTWTPSNRAVRDHADLGLDLLFFERVQRKDGLWRFAQIFQYFSHKLEQRPDKTGKNRSAIVFGLLPITTAPQTVQNEAASMDLDSLRSAADAAADPQQVGVRLAIRNVYVRSEAVRCYALRRASGKCEACDSVAPFKDVSGQPFLEVHHIDRLADNGPDKVDRVAAICPNCHRRCHYSNDQRQYNSALRIKIAALEGFDRGESGKI